MMPNSRKSETYNIKILSDIHEDLTPAPEVLPQVTGITSHEILRDMMHSFQHMAKELTGKLYVSRTLYFWCDRCDAYIGSREVEYIARKFQYYREVTPSMTVACETETHKCPTCKEISSFNFQPVMYLLY
jgi:hypothetical protein